MTLNWEKKEDTKTGAVTHTARNAAGRVMFQIVPGPEGTVLLKQRTVWLGSEAWQESKHPTVFAAQMAAKAIEF